MRFYRGIAVKKNETEEVIEGIRKSGHKAGDGSWAIMAPDLKEEYRDQSKWAELLRNENLSTRMTRAKSVETVGVCGDSDSASYYACVHNRTEEHDTPILIELDARGENAWIDGRDFLYTVVQLWDRRGGSEDNKERVRDTLARAFGKSIIPYLNRALLDKELDSRLALVDMATNDSAVIKAHASNEHWLQGRYGTIFKCAFSIRLPIRPAQILSVQIVDTEFRRPDSFSRLNDLIS